jgi:hypothetical protein
MPKQRKKHVRVPEVVAAPLPESPEPLIIRHWTITNGSGMHHAAEACAKAERQLGHESFIVDLERQDMWGGAEEADVHVLHTDFPEAIRAKITKPYALVFVAHGTPECVMETTIENHARPGYGQADGWGTLRHILKTVDAIITFWPRHQAFYQSCVPRERKIHCVPMGVDTAFWAGGTSLGKYAGVPSVWTSENQHRIKWVLDLLMCWPWVAEKVRTVKLHGHYIPMPLHRFFLDLANSNGAAAAAYLSASYFPHDQLRNIWKGIDFFLSPVRYGDHNCVFLQAAATGMQTISYRGNVYADFWITEGDQREMAKELVAILSGQVPPRADKTPVPNLSDMGTAMIDVYRAALAALPPRT